MTSQYEILRSHRNRILHDGKLPLVFGCELNNDVVAKKGITLRYIGKSNRQHAVDATNPDGSSMMLMVDNINDEILGTPVTFVEIISMLPFGSWSFSHEHDGVYFKLLSDSEKTYEAVGVLIPVPDWPEATLKAINELL